MVHPAWYALLIPHVAALLAHLAGLVIAVVLLVRARSRAAVLAVVGFTLLVLIAIAQIVLGLPAVSWELVQAEWLIWVLNCCCSIIDVIAIACLISAIWQAVSAGIGGVKPAQEPAPTVEDWEESEEAPQEAVEVFEEAPEEGRYTTVELEEVEEATFTEVPAETPYATRVLEEEEAPEEMADDTASASLAEISGEIVEEGE
jgi:hypothetical protein